MSRNWTRWAVLGTALVALTAGLSIRFDLQHYVWAYFALDIGAPVATKPLEPFSAADLPTLRLAVAGDVGTGGVAEQHTADAIDALESERPFDALLLLGDNAYPDGDPEQLQNDVFGPFAEVLDGQTQLLAVLGNHDVRNSNGDAEAAALGMPGRWYATTVDDVLIVALDSTEPDNADQVAWLEATLAANGAPWKIAIMHHPPYSAGWHGSSTDVRQAFVPLFERYGVQLVLAGHDHDYQRSEPINGITYIVTGAAAKSRSTGMADFTAAAWSTYHFVDLAIFPDRIEGRAIDQTGRYFDQFTINTNAPR